VYTQDQEHVWDFLIRVFDLHNGSTVDFKKGFVGLCNRRGTLITHKGLPLDREKEGEVWHCTDYLDYCLQVTQKCAEAYGVKFELVSAKSDRASFTLEDMPRPQPRQRREGYAQIKRKPKADAVWAVICNRKRSGLYEVLSNPFI
jgi:hypothetical protein